MSNKDDSALQANPSPRRQFLKMAGAGAVRATALVTVSQLLSSSAKAKTTQQVPATDGGEKLDPLIRMQQELLRALNKPEEQRRWGMVIDTRKCVGCHSCTVGCVLENKLPPGVVYRPVLDVEIGTYPNVRRRFLPRPCMQCDNPPCVPVCPVKATWKRQDGIVEIDYKACIGCRYCITACPYQARTFDFGANWTDNAAHGEDGAFALKTGRAYEKNPNFEYGNRYTRSEGVIPRSPVGNARKCTFCLHRLEKGQLPMCITTCIGRAGLFGDLNDPTALVSEAVSANNSVRLKDELGTAPKVFYLL